MIPKILEAYKWHFLYVAIFVLGYVFGGGSATFTTGDMKLELKGSQNENVALDVQVKSLRKQLDDKIKECP